MPQQASRRRVDPDRAAVARSERGETATLDRLIADDFVLDRMTGDGDEQVIRRDAARTCEALHKYETC